jgi:hypothetical protein
VELQVDGEAYTDIGAEYGSPFDLTTCFEENYDNVLAKTHAYCGFTLGIKLEDM